MSGHAVAALLDPRGAEDRLPQTAHGSRGARKGTPPAASAASLRGWWQGANCVAIGVSDRRRDPFAVSVAVEEAPSHAGAAAGLVAEEPWPHLEKPLHGPAELIPVQGQELGRISSTTLVKSVERLGHAAPAEDAQRRPRPRSATRLEGGERPAAAAPATRRRASVRPRDSATRRKYSADKKVVAWSLVWSAAEDEARVQQRLGDRGWASAESFVLGRF